MTAKRKTSKNEEDALSHPHIGRRVRVQCSDGEKYDGTVIEWDAAQSEYKIIFDDGEWSGAYFLYPFLFVPLSGDELHSPLDSTSWDVEFLGVNGSAVPKVKPPKQTPKRIKPTAETADSDSDFLPESPTATASCLGAVRRRPTPKRKPDLTTPKKADSGVIEDIAEDSDVVPIKPARKSPGGAGGPSKRARTAGGGGGSSGGRKRGGKQAAGTAKPAAGPGGEAEGEEVYVCERG